MPRLALLPLTLALFVAAARAQTPEASEFFEKKVRPILVKSCQGCHNTRVKMAGLDVSSAEAFHHGGASGSLVSKDDPSQSLLLRVTSYDEKLKMPPTGKLKDEERADLATWVAAGAPWPGAAPVAAARPAEAGRSFTDAERAFWAFQPVANAGVPAVTNPGWVRSPVDAFVLQKLQAKGLSPAAPASKAALLRRATFDLTGLPPTEQELRDFLADASPDAFAKVVDRLLASPRYGEKWGRHWLDVARYADSTGNDEDHRYPYAWRYRDYVIEAFNQDVPYDRFIREQLAGDLLPSPEPGVPNRRGIVATGLLALGAKAIAQQDKKKMLYDVYDEQVDVVSKAFLGLTVACARCHDHKFDPILTKDYYSLISIFASTRSFKDSESHVAKLLFTPLVPTPDYERYTKHQERVTRKGMEIEDVTDEQRSAYIAQLTPRLADYMTAAHAVYAGKQDPADVAKRRGLREDVLRKMAKYLAPNGERLPHLDEWREAPAERLPEIAKEYQTRFEAQSAAWSERIDKWRERFRKMTAEGNMPPPARPKFEATKDRFFFEVYFEGPFGLKKDEQEKAFSAEARTRLAALRTELQALKDASPPEPDMACAVQEGEPVQQKVFVRGDYASPGPDAPKAFPLILAGPDQPSIPQGSGRLELANWLARPDHPLTARVMVNRMWLWHFGEGLVRTPDNFGKMGEKPTHPELLDWLARRFVADGWSMKKMHRTMMLSSAYQMGTQASDGAVKADPENRLFSRFPRRRLTVEELRDGLLAIDGSLDVTMGGTLQKGFGTDSENSNSRLSVKPEAEKRRLVYLPLRRANLPTLLNLFDFGDATSMQGRRTLTTVAPQALFMMNSEFVQERSRRLAEWVANQGPADPSGRVRRLYERVLNREPEPAEVDGMLTYLSGFQRTFAGARTEADAWLSLSRILIASNEFVYLD